MTANTTIKTFILSEFLPGEAPDALTASTPLMSSGILDSLATLKLITFLEEQFGVSIAAHEADEENFETIDDINKLVQSKR
jgi:acyl carrier protein